jgi:hypothetical protein
MAARRILNRNRQPLPDRQQRLLDLIQTRSVVEVEQAVDLRQVAMQTPGELRLPDPRRPHVPVQFDLRLGQSRERDKPLPAFWAAGFRDRQTVLDHAHQVSFKRIHGSRERFRLVVSVGVDVREIGE